MSEAIAAAIVSLNDADLQALLVGAARLRDELPVSPRPIDRVWSSTYALLAELAAGERDKRANDWPAFIEDVEPNPFVVSAVELPGRD